jgi:hypothetical protein
MLQRPVSHPIATSLLLVARFDFDFDSGSTVRLRASTLRTSDRCSTPRTTLNCALRQEINQSPKAAALPQCRCA